MRRLSPGAAAVFGLVLFAGCAGDGPPLTTDGPNQVLFRVPGMT